ncbi:DEHA2F10450p [Debaryomyces hansenii CBS767]|uniref:Glutamate decarboxylase n=1 Tax=Debaryomyces hansenii (strain ATCC 36239 / CBS 767 / BCRC 21394 / JCM 1990 / NBRC 0083 / IGC 2968) TaxID=284592 RepID=B5RUD7_DEBHA|nr:DEHA2F10450p [Debaryomyces hansenii CBS767]CAR66315.1 DEHA2F10450p [Debaryomyces hansenii CBS767]|eukprot:XP_002770790.1 DEHA2F10450p [Debaryomyces hansenii CBS767]
MTLSKHINAEDLESKLLKQTKKTVLDNHEEYIFKYSANATVPKYEIPEKSSNSELVYKYISEELSLDGIPTLNLASFVNTNIDDIPLRLASENITKNLADNDEYPSLIDIQGRCVTILSNLWNAPSTTDKESGKKVINSIGSATTGSSEAIMMAGLAMKKSWQARQKANGKSIAEPNILMASCAQVALEKFARYFDVENRIIHINEKSGHLIDTTKIKENIDENTIGIFVILGSTFTGAFEPVEEISKLLDEVEKERGIDVKIHVDGASGGFVAPFVYPHLKWDFSIDRVISINTSGHKFGLTSAGLGWIIWKDNKYLPDDVRFKLDYLGGVEETFTFNFSRPGFPVLFQYYNFLTLGREGYTKIFNSCIQNARLLSNFLEESGYFECLSVIHKGIDKERQAKIFTREHNDSSKHSKKAVVNEEYEPGLPVVAFRFSKEIREKYPDIPQSILSLLLRNKGYIIPNYKLSPDEQDIEILRVVVRDTLGLNLLDKLMNEIVSTIELLINATDTITNLSTKEQSSEKNEMIYSMLLSIASNGGEDLKEIKQQILKDNNEQHRKHAKSYRGTC